MNHQPFRMPIRSNTITINTDSCQRAYHHINVISYHISFCHILLRPQTNRSFGYLWVSNCDWPSDSYHNTNHCHSMLTEVSLHFRNKTRRKARNCGTCGTLDVWVWNTCLDLSSTCLLKRTATTGSHVFAPGQLQGSTHPDILWKTTVFFVKKNQLMILSYNCCIKMPDLISILYPTILQCQTSPVPARPLAFRYFGLHRSTALNDLSGPPFSILFLAVKATETQPPHVFLGSPNSLCQHFGSVANLDPPKRTPRGTRSSVVPPPGCCRGLVGWFSYLFFFFGQEEFPLPT